MSVLSQAGLLALAVAHAPTLSLSTVALCVPVAYYVVFSYLDGTEYREGKPMDWLRTWERLYAIIGNSPSSYFKPRIVYDDEAALKAVERLGPDKERCIFACFPHGVVSFHHGILMTCLLYTSPSPRD